MTHQIEEVIAQAIAAVREKRGGRPYDTWDKYYGPVIAFNLREMLYEEARAILSCITINPQGDNIEKLLAAAVKNAGGKLRIPVDDIAKNHEAVMIRVWHDEATNTLEVEALRGSDYLN